MTGRGSRAESHNKRHTYAMSNCQYNINGNSSFAINESRWRRSMSATCASLTNWPNSFQWRDACCNASNLRVGLACARHVKRKTSPHGSSAAETSGRLIARLQSHTITHTWINSFPSAHAVAQNDESTHALLTHTPSLPT